MRANSILFGLISGLSTTFGFLPYIFSLCSILLLALPMPPMGFFVLFAIFSRVMAEGFFWFFSKERMDTEESLKDWRIVVNWSLLSHPNVVIASTFFFVDIAMEGILIYFAIKLGVSPVWAFLALLGAQAGLSTIQGLISDIYSRKNSLLFTFAMGSLAFLAAETIFLGDRSLLPLLNALQIPSMELKTQILLILCWKGVFSNVGTVARVAIADVIRAWTLEENG